MDVDVRLGNWSQMQAHVTPIRLEVFVIEQKVPVEEEVDPMDAQCVHACAFDAQGHPIGTGRLLPDGHVGRMSVLRACRGMGVGSALLNALVEEARRLKFECVVLHAQTHAIGFYVTHGFVKEGEEFYEANIAHMVMRKRLEPAG